MEADDSLFFSLHIGLTSNHTVISFFFHFHQIKRQKHQFTMKLTLWTLFLPTIAALQSGYLSQLTAVNGGSYNGAQVNGGAFNGAQVNGGSTSTAPLASPAFVSSSSSGGPSQKLLSLWSDQVSVELAASQLYLSASIWFNDRDLKGMSAVCLDVGRIRRRERSWIGDP